jgi:hypothetical protein
MFELPDDHHHHFFKKAFPGDNTPHTIHHIITIISPTPTYRQHRSIYYPVPHGQSHDRARTRTDTSHRRKKRKATHARWMIKIRIPAAVVAQIPKAPAETHPKKAHSRPKKKEDDDGDFFLSDAVGRKKSTTTGPAKKVAAPQKRPRARSPPLELWQLFGSDKDEPDKPPKDKRRKPAAQQPAPTKAKPVAAAAAAAAVAAPPHIDDRAAPKFKPILGKALAAMRPTAASAKRRKDRQQQGVVIKATVPHKPEAHGRPPDAGQRRPTL